MCAGRSLKQRPHDVISSWYKRSVWEADLCRWWIYRKSPSCVHSEAKAFRGICLRARIMWRWDLGCLSSFVLMLAVTLRHVSLSGAKLEQTKETWTGVAPRSSRTRLVFQKTSSWEKPEQRFRSSVRKKHDGANHIRLGRRWDFILATLKP